MTSITPVQDQHMTSMSSAQDQHMTSISSAQDQHMTSITSTQDQHMTSISSAQDQQMTSISSAQDQHVTSISSAECLTVSEDQRKTSSFTLTEFQHATTRSTSAENQHATRLVSHEDQNTPSTSFSQASSCTPKKTNIDDHNESHVIILLNKKGPLSKKEEKACTSLIKRKMAEEGGVIKCKTGGQPICLVKVRKARKERSKVRTPLKRKRNREINMVRAVVAGKSGTITQQSSELKALSKDTKLQVCASAGVKQSAKFNAYQQQALKSALRLTWSQVRGYKRFFKDISVEYESESRERQVRDSVTYALMERNINFWYKCDKAPNSVNGMAMGPRPSVYVENLPQFVTTLLNDYSDAKKLTWENMPQNEVWVKIGADHGGGSFKVCLQILNLDAPNSKEHTVVIGCFEAKDLYPNLVKISGLFREGVQALGGMTWKGKILRCFVFGDYAFLANLYGISGPAGIHCCLWCHITKDGMQLPLAQRRKSSEQTIESIRSDNASFRIEGDSNKSKASKFNNCINKPLWNIAIDHVCPPYLHILLGVIKKHHDLLEEATHQIDKAIAVDLANSEIDPPADTLFEKHVAKMRQIRRLTQEKNAKEREYQFERKDRSLEPNQRREVRDALKGRINALEETLKKCILEAELDKLSGPVTANLELVLKDHNIKLQAHHSRSMTGNHCAMYVREKTHTALLKSVISKTKELTDNQDIIMEAETIESRFNELNSAFYKVHSLVSHSRHVSPCSIPEIESAIVAYLCKFRQFYPGCITPKLHFLEDHVIEWLTRWQFGMGRHGEQGGEAAHKEFNRILRNMGNFQGLRRLVATMKDHHASIHPKVVSHIVSSKPRKSTNKF